MLDETVRDGYEIGGIIGLYELIERIDAPGVGQTYRARDIETGAMELMRVLPQVYAEDEAAQRFMREVKILRDLTHPNIVVIRQAGHSYGRMFLTTEIPEGRPLAQRLAAEAPSLSDSLGYMRQILSALECIHNANVVHRSLAPTNIYISDDGAVKVSGFSFARMETDPSLTTRAAVVGVLGYMSPEQAAGGSVGVDRRSDLYSAAAVLYHAVAGEPPFAGKPYFHMMKDHQAGVVAQPAEVRPGIPQALNRIIVKGLAKDPDERFQTAREFHAALASIDAPDVV